jgi:hypothetical protein
MSMGKEIEDDFKIERPELILDEKKVKKDLPDSLPDVLSDVVPDSESSNEKHHLSTLVSDIDIFLAIKDYASARKAFDEFLELSEPYKELFEKESKRIAQELRKSEPFLKRLFGGSGKKKVNQKPAQKVDKHKEKKTKKK